MTDAAATAPPASSDDEEVVQPPEDQRRQELLAQLAEALGDGLVEHHLVPGRDLWIRVHRDRWQDVGRAVRNLGFTYFGFLSAIDWMVAPEGRYEDTEFEDEPVVTDIEGLEESEGDTADQASGEAGASQGDAGAEEGEAPPAPATTEAAPGSDDGRPQMASHRVAGGETRFQVLARVQKPGTDLGITLKADLPDGDERIDTWVDLYRGANWHEREAWEMFGIEFTGHPDLRHVYLPSDFEGHPLRKDFPLLARVVKPWPGVVDIEEIPPHLEEKLEAEVMAAFEASQGGGESAGGGEGS